MPFIQPILVVGGGRGEDGQLRTLPITIDTQGEVLYAVEKILKSKRTKQKGFQYLIQWRGYDKPSWEPLCNVVNARASIIEFEKLNRGRHVPRPTKTETRDARLQAEGA